MRSRYYWNAQLAKGNITQEQYDLIMDEVEEYENE